MSAIYCGLIRIGIKYLNGLLNKFRVKLKVMHCSKDIIRMLITHKGKKVFDYTIYL